MVNRVASQRDISPTILSILGKNTPDAFTGKSLDNSNNAPYFSDYYHSGTLGWIEDDMLIEIQVNAPNKMSCYNYVSDKLLEKKLKCPDKAKNSRNNALAFTKKSQSLLFNGKLKDWIYK